MLKRKEEIGHGQGVVAYAYNSSYAGGRDQGVCGLRPARAKIL
jgi:hypothetical protein